MSNSIVIKIFRIYNSFCFSAYRNNIFIFLLLFSLSTISQESFAVESNIIKKTKPLHVPLYINNHQKNIVKILLSEGDVQNSLVKADDIINILQNIAGSRVVGNLKKLHKNEYISFRELNENNIKINFDPNQLILSVNIDPKDQKTNQLSGRGQYNFNPQDLVPPSDVSGFVNFRAAQDYLHETLGYTSEEKGRLPFAMQLDGALNLKGLVLEGRGNYLENSPENEWERDDMRLVYDDEKRLIRYGLGDLSYPVTSFQSFQEMLGFSFSKDYSIAPYTISQPTGSSGFLLERDANVEIFVNEIRINNLKLSAGSYDITDFPVTNGSNDVKLVITDSFGQVEVKRLNVVSDQDLLGKGFHRYSYNAGVSSETIDREKSYNENQEVFSAFHNYGLTDNLTVGANVQGSELQYMGGGDLVYGSDFGISALKAAFSDVGNVGSGEAFEVSHRITNYRGPESNFFRNQNGTFSFLTRYRSQYFAPLGNLNPENDYSYEFNANYNQNITNGANVGIGSSYRIGRKDNENDHKQSLFYGQRLFGNFNLNLSLEYRKNDDLGGFLNLSWTPIDSRHAVNLNYDSFGKIARADYNYNKISTEKGVSATASVIRTENDQLATGELDIYNQRAELEISHDVVNKFSDSSINRESENQLVSRARLATGIAFSGKKFVLTKPVSNSFTIIAAHESLKGKEIGVNQAESFDKKESIYEGRVDELGPAILPNLSPYLYKNVRIDASDIPAGYNIGKDSYVVKPTYKSGYLISIGSDANVFVTGQLRVDEKIASLKAGKVISLSDKKTYDFFTNKEGKFFVEGLKAGKYAMELFDYPNKTTNFEISKKSAGQYSLGTLILF